MVPDISEFSYGFAITNELIDMAGPLKAAPIFPSLIEEGRAGGGYDVRLDLPGFPLFIQFKRSDCMIRASAKEVIAGIIHNPFYRMKITDSTRSDQHNLLLTLDVGANMVFYSAPLFHTVHELNDAYLNTQVVARSAMFRPRDIGHLTGAHHIAFNSTNAYLCSDPIRVKSMPGEGLDSALQKRLKEDDRPFGKGPITEMVARSERALRRSGIQPPPASDLPATLTSKGTPEQDSVRYLKRASDLALRYFGSQLFIVQKKD